MGFIKPANNVIFIEQKIEDNFNSLNENDWLKKALNRSIQNLKVNIFCGENIPKRLIPIIYIQKYQIDNLYHYNLPNGCRIVYTIITLENKECLAVIIEYFSHPEYEKRFHY